MAFNFQKGFYIGSLGNPACGMSGKRKSEMLQDLRKDTALISRHGQSNGIKNPKFVIRNSYIIRDQEKGWFLNVRQELFTKQKLKKNGGSSCMQFQKLS